MCAYCMIDLLESLLSSPLLTTSMSYLDTCSSYATTWCTELYNGRSEYESGSCIDSDTAPLLQVRVEPSAEIKNAPQLPTIKLCP